METTNKTVDQLKEELREYLSDSDIEAAEKETELARALYIKTISKTNDAYAAWNLARQKEARLKYGS